MKKRKVYASLATATILANVLVGPGAVLADQVTAPSSTAQSSQTSVSSESSAPATSESTSTPSSSAASDSTTASTDESKDTTTATPDEPSTTTPAEPSQPAEPSTPTEPSQPTEPSTPAEVVNTFSVTFVNETDNQIIGNAQKVETTDKSHVFNVPSGYTLLNGAKTITVTTAAPTQVVKVKKIETPAPSTPAQPAQPAAPSTPTPAQPAAPATPAPAAPSTPAASTPAPATTDTATATDQTVVPETDTSDLVYKYDYNNDTAKFIASIAEQSRVIAADNNLYASVMIAQAILESGSGSSTLSQAPNYNLFGIKGSYNKQSVKMLTQEDSGNGSLYTITSNFKRYDSTSASLQDYASLLKNGTIGNANIYAKAWKSNAKTPADAAKALQGLYATDTSYAAKLDGLIKEYDLTKYDKATNYEVTQYSAKNKENQNVFDGQAGKIKNFKDTNFTGQAVKGQTLDAQNDTIVRLLSTATSQLGTPYVWGSSVFSTDVKTGGLDCSGLTQQTYLKALGIKLPRTSEEQSTVGKMVAVDVKDLQPGDLLFVGKPGSVHHVAMYLTNGYFIEAPQPGGTVQIGNIKSEHFDFAKRIIGSTKATPISLKAYVAYMKSAVEARQSGNLNYGNDAYYTAKADGTYQLVENK